MSVDNPYSGGNRFTGSGTSELLVEAARGGRYALGSPIGGGLAGTYTAEQILQMLAEQLATAPPDSAMLTGTNGLFRINWFDGRFLTAQAFRQQDSYWDTRLRLLAQIFPPGISWGLGLGGVEATLKPYPPRGQEDGGRSGGVSMDTPFSLQPGVAFDGLGRPIVVGQSFDFCFRDLIPRFQSAPRQVATGATRFRACLCLEPLDGGNGTPGSTLPTGPYLLVIEPRETPEGDAKVYGEVCAGEEPARCESNGFRGGFGLSLVRFPADPPAGLTITSAWDLRGILSAYYFDVYEHSLIDRWDPEFARDDAFCDPVGSPCQQAGAVPLAMLFIGNDGSLLFLDPWIPRRGLAATQAADWTRTRLGAPAQSAADARLHQFQCMLVQSLRHYPLLGQTEADSQPRNLFDRGFRHIPPVGFLPFDPYNTLADVFDDNGNLDTGKLFSQIPVIANLGQVQRQVDRYFCGTSVVPYYVVALHDDDIIEDIGNAFHKDPVRVGRLSEIDDSISGPIAELCEGNAEGPRFSGMLTRFFEMAMATVRLMLADTDLLVNRDVEIVKVVVPLQGLKRQHPLVGVTDEDTAASIEDWYSRPPGQNATLLDGLARNLLVQFLRQRFGMEALPRHFVVYVKQRMVLLDAIYLMFEFFNEMLAFINSFQLSNARMDTSSLSFGSAAGAATAFDLQMFRSQAQGLPAVQQAAARAALGNPIMRDLVAHTAITVNPELARPAMWDTFFTQVDAEEARLADQVSDPVLRRQQALDRVTEAQAAETPGFELIKVLVAAQDPDGAEASLRSVRRAAALRPAVDARGRPLDLGLNQELLHGGGLRVFESGESRTLWQAVKTGLERQPASKLEASIAADVTMAEVLRRSPAEAERVLGGRESVDALRKAIRPKIDKVAREIDAVAANPPSEAVRASYARNLEAANGDPVKALSRTQTQFKNDAEAAAVLKRVKPMADLLGRDGFGPVADVVFGRTG